VAGWLSLSLSLSLYIYIYIYLDAHDCSDAESRTEKQCQSEFVLEVAREEVLALAQRTDFGRVRWTRPKHALEGCQLQLFCSSSCV
jgi:hypothetical protein